MIEDIDSEWCETNILCPVCKGMTYTNGRERPTCPECLAELSDETIWTWLTYTPEYQAELKGIYP